MAAKKSKGLIKVKKDDEVIEINPKMLPQHEALGWKPVGKIDDESAEDADDATDEKTEKPK